ncbi:MAG: rhomboid family intramembrane serine protease [Bacilli bacterium]
MNDITMSASDEIVMKLLHYFVTEQNYSPIVLKGAQNEIWLEKLDGDYKVVRLVSNYIHNNEQLNLDLYRTKQIMKRIKKKTMSFSLNTLSVFVNLGDNVNLLQIPVDDIDCVNIKSIDDFKNYDYIMDEFPTITKKTNFKEEGLDLFIKLTTDIGKKNEIEQKKAEDVFTKRDPMVTKIILVINIVVYLLSLIIGPNAVLQFGSNFKPYVVNGEFYRLITAAFIHVNLLHFLFNNYALYIIGPQVENFFGKTRYIIIYLGSAILGNMLSLCFNADTPSIGASGAIFGILGALLYFGYHYRVYLDGVIKSQIVPLIVLNLLIGFTSPTIDNAAHIGGLIGGFLVSMAVGVKYKSKKPEIVNGIVLTLLFTAFLGFMIFFR